MNTFVLVQCTCSDISFVLFQISLSRFLSTGSMPVTHTPVLVELYKIVIFSGV